MITTLFRADVAGPKRLLDRRGTIRFLGGLMLAALTGMRAAFAQKKLAVGLDKVEKLKSPGGSALLKIQSRELLFIRDSESSVRVLDPTCTHKKCTVEYSTDKRRIVCPCHGSNYDLEGKVLKGPAEKPLRTFEAVLDRPNNRIVFSLE